MDTIIDALELAGFTYTRDQTLLRDSVTVYGWSGGTMQVREDICTGEMDVLEVWGDGNSNAGTYSAENVAFWIVSQA